MRRAVDLPVLIVIGAALGIGKAVETTGLAAVAATGIEAVAVFGPVVTLLVVYGIANGLAELIMEVSGKSVRLNHIPGPLGVRGRNSDNRLIAKELGWAPSQPLIEGIRKTYEWIEGQVQAALGA